jgi:hypothetical protein
MGVQEDIKRKGRRRDPSLDPTWVVSSIKMDADYLNQKSKMGYVEILTRNNQARKVDSGQ